MAIFDASIDCAKRKGSCRASGTSVGEGCCVMAHNAMVHEPEFRMEYCSGLVFLRSGGAQARICL